MAKCRIKKYDELPSRVGFTDVDFLRYLLSKEKNPKTKEKIIAQLDEIASDFVPIEELAREEIMMQEIKKGFKQQYYTSHFLGSLILAFMGIYFKDVIMLAVFVGFTLYSLFKLRKMELQDGIVR